MNLKYNNDSSFFGNVLFLKLIVKQKLNRYRGQIHRQAFQHIKYWKGRFHLETIWFPWLLNSSRNEILQGKVITRLNPLIPIHQFSQAVHYTEVHFASFLSSEVTTAMVVNLTKRKLAKYTSVFCTVVAVRRVQIVLIYRTCLILRERLNSCT